MMVCRFFAIFLLLTSLENVVLGVRVKGSISVTGSKAKLYYLTRFGVGSGQNFYVYGVARNQYSTSESQFALGLVPQETWNRLYPASRRDLHCDKVFMDGALEASMIVDGNCNGDETRNKDYIRTLPCTPGSCNQPNTTENFYPFNFTYKVENVQRTEFFYLFFLNCKLKTDADNCQWHHSANASLDYDIHLVNGVPNKSNSYSNEFSFELQGTLTLHLFFTIAYIFLIGIHFLLHSRGLQKRKRYSIHLLIKLFSASVVLEGVYVLTEMIHSSIYASNGIGAVPIKYIGEVCNQVSDWLLILSVILVGKGWQVTTSSLRWSKVTVFIWGAYIVFSAIFFIWTVISEQVYPLSIGLYHGYQSWAGGVYLAYRLFILLYILHEMRQVYLIENRRTALRLYIILATCYMIWFFYLPLLTLLAIAVNPVRRRLVILAVYLTFDFLINIGMVILFCPLWANRYFQFEHYINILSQSSNYRSLKSYGGREIPTPI